jgi:hypothetical protein
MLSHIVRVAPAVFLALTDRCRNEFYRRRTVRGRESVPKCSRTHIPADLVASGDDERRIGTGGLYPERLIGVVQHGDGGILAHAETGYLLDEGSAAERAGIECAIALGVRGIANMTTQDTQIASVIMRVNEDNPIADPGRRGGDQFHGGRAGRCHACALV